MKRLRYILLAAATALLALVWGCAQPQADTTTTATPPETAAEVNLYSSRHYDTDEALYEGFSEQTGIAVNLVEASADELIERIKSEGENSPADVLITVDAGRLWRATEEGILQPIKSETLESAIPENLRDPEGRWFGLSKRARVIIYNKENVDPSELSSYEDLADPKWQGRVLVRSSNNIYNQSLVGSLIANLGEEETETWAKGLVENFARPPEGNDTDQIEAVAQGIGDVAIVNSYYVTRLAESDDPDARATAEKIGVFFPNQGEDGRGTHVNISGAGVVKTAPHPEAAVEFIEYLASPEAQTIFAAGNYEYPAVEGVEVNETLAQYGEFKNDSLSAAEFGSKNADALRLMDRAGWK